MGATTPWGPLLQEIQNLIKIIGLDLNKECPTAAVPTARFDHDVGRVLFFRHKSWR